MRQIAFLLLLSLVMVLSCTTVPEGQASVDPVVPQEAAGAPVTGATAAEPSFDPNAISAAVYDATMAEIQALIDELNRIIRARNYNAWRDHLSDFYFEQISSEEFLEARSEELFRRDQMVAQNMGRNPRLVTRRNLRNARDYFDHVVVPSRSNDRVDDISFVSADNIIAYTEDNRGQRLILYNFVMIDNLWKIDG